MIAGALAGTALVRQLGPARIEALAESALESAAGVPVRAARTAVDLAKGRLVAEDLSLDLPGGRARAWIDRVEVLVDPLGFLTRSPRARNLRLEGGTIHLGAPAPAPIPGSRPSAMPAAVEHGLDILIGGARDPVDPILEALRALFDLPLRTATVELRSVRLSFRTSDSEAPLAGPERFAVVLEQGRIVRRRLRRDQLLTAAGWLVRRDRERVRFELRARRAGAETLELTLAVPALSFRESVEALRRAVPGWHTPGLAGARAPHPAPATRVEGVVGGVARLEVDGPRRRLEIDLVGEELGIATGATEPVRVGRALAQGELRWETTPSGPRAPATGSLTVDLRRLEAGPVAGPAALHARLELARDAATVDEGWLEVEGLGRLELAGRIDRPLGAAAPTHLALGARRLPLSSLAGRLAGYRPVAGRVAALAPGGELADVEIELRGPMGALAAHLGEVRKEAPPAEIVARASLRPTRVATPRGPLELRADSIELRPGAMAVAGLRARLADRELPAVDLTLSGLERLADADLESLRPVPAVGPTPGLETALRWLVREIEHADPRYRPERIDLSLARLRHPALLLPWDTVRARVHPRAGGFDFELAEAWLGRLPLSGRGRFEAGGAGRLELELEVGNTALAPLPEALRTPTDAWLLGAVEVQPVRIRRLALTRLSADLRGRGAELSLDPATGDLGSPGRIEARAEFDLSEDGAAPFSLRARIRDARLDDLALRLGAPAEGFGGLVEGSATLAGRLTLEEVIAPTLRGEIELTARDGSLSPVLPLVAQLSGAGEEGEPAPLPFRGARLTARLTGGRMEIPQLALDAEGVRVVVTGSIEGLAREPRVSAVAGVFFYRDVDRVLANVPLLNDLLLGEDRNLIGAYFELRGPIGDPEARRIPNRTFASGAPGFVLLDVPEFLFRDVPVSVVRGLRSLGSRMGRGETEKPEPPQGGPDREG